MPEATRSPAARIATIPAGLIQRRWKSRISCLDMGGGASIEGVALARALAGTDCILAAMPLISRQTAPIAVYGATGYTGRLVAAELAEAGADFVISGRNPVKLEALRADLGLESAPVTASIYDPGSLRALLADCSAVINCAGPFVKLGEPVLRAAIETGTHYLDTSGEQPWMQ